MKSYTQSQGVSEEKIFQIVQEGAQDLTEIIAQINLLIDASNAQASLIQSLQNNILTLSNSHNTLATKVVADSAKITTLQSQMAALQARVTDTEVKNEQQDTILNSLSNTTTSNFNTLTSHIEVVSKVLLSNFTFQTFGIMHLYQALTRFTTEFVFWTGTRFGNMSNLGNALSAWSFPTGSRYQDRGVAPSNTGLFWVDGWRYLAFYRTNCGNYTGNNAYTILQQFGINMTSNYSTTLVNGAGQGNPIPDKLGMDDYRENTIIVWQP